MLAIELYMDCRMVKSEGPGWAKITPFLCSLHSMSFQKANIISGTRWCRPQVHGAEVCQEIENRRSEGLSVRNEGRRRSRGEGGPKIVWR